MMMEPAICLLGDYIVRKGEIADEIFFIKKGLVRVMCADRETVVLAYMGDGSYFGEIGVLLTGKRSTNVIAQTNCVLYKISKNKLEKLLVQFPSHKVFLESVGKQRFATTYFKDLNLDGSHLPKNNHEIIGESSTSVRFRNNNLEEYTVDPNSNFHLIGSILLAIAISWNIVYTIFAICFEDTLNTNYNPIIITLDVIAYLIYIFDLPFKLYVANSL